MRIRKHLLNFTKHDLLNMKEKYIVGELVIITSKTQINM